MYHYFVETSNGVISFMREATHEEYEMLSQCIERISCLNIDDTRIQIVKHSYNELMDAVKRINDGDTMLATNDCLASKLTGFLSCTRKYLDNWETHLKSKYGKNSTEVELFSKETGNLYDNYPEYCFMYRLRNFDQHCEIVFSKFTEYIGDDGKAHRIILVNRERLLNSPFTGWKQIDKDFIKRKDEDFDILPIIQVYYNCLLELHSKLLHMHLNKDFFNDCVSVLKVVNEFENEDCISIFSSEVEFNADFIHQNNKEFQCTYLYVPECKYLLKQLLKENRAAIRILAYGEEFCSRLQGVADIVSMEDVSTITSSKCRIIKFQDQPFIKWKLHLQLEASLVALFIHMGFSNEEKRTIMDEFSSYVDALLKI